MVACRVLLQVKQEVGHGGKKHLALPLAAQEANNAIVESTSDARETSLVSDQNVPWHSRRQSVLPPVQCDMSCNPRPLHILLLKWCKTVALLEWDLSAAGLQSKMGCRT